MMAMIIRRPFLFLFWITGQFASLSERANYTTIGFTGYVSMLDKDVAKVRELKPLNRFERWVLKPIIETEQQWRREQWRQTVINVTGENPGP